MASPGVHHAQEAGPRVTLVVVIVTGYELQHVAIVRLEVVIHQTKHSRSQRKVAVVKVVVVISVRVVAGIIADETPIAVVTGKEEIIFARRVGQPVHQSFLKPVVTLCKQLLVAHLAGEGHVQCHLRQSLTAPVGIATEGARLGIVSQHLKHFRRVVGIIDIRIGRHGIPGQHAGESIANAHLVRGHEFQLSTRCLVGLVEERVTVRCVALPPVVGYLSLQHLRSRSACQQVGSTDFPIGTQVTTTIAP